MRLAPEVLAAGRVRWQVFATLTFRGQGPSPENGRRKVRVWLRHVARLARVPYERLVWFAREEMGEKFGRLHFHVLIAGLPSSLIGFDFGFIMAQSWREGFSSARQWVEGLGALDYCSEDGANVYEGKKFVANQPIMLSESLANVVVTGDNVDREDAEHCDNPEVVIRRPMGAGSCQWGALEKPPFNGVRSNEVLLAVNATRTGVVCHYHQAAITGA